MTREELIELGLDAVRKKCRTFGGGWAIKSNPISVAMADKPLAFAAGADVAEAIDALLAAWEQAGWVVERGWQGIETAPKDRTRILLLFPPPYSDSLDTGHAVGCWYDHWWVTCVWAASTAHHDPIAWRPLPASPSLAKTAEGK